MLILWALRLQNDTDNGMAMLLLYSSNNSDDNLLTKTKSMKLAVWKYVLWV